MAQTAQGSPLTEEGAKAAAQAKDWLEKWEKRSTWINQHCELSFYELNTATVDNTLLLLYNSAVSRGLAHKLTRNLATLSSLRKAWLCSAYERPGAPWNPTGKQMHARTKKSRDRKNELGESAWNMVREVVRMAEGRDRLVLGLPTPPQRKTYRDHE